MLVKLLLALRKYGLTIIAGLTLGVSLILAYAWTIGYTELAQQFPSLSGQLSGWLSELNPGTAYAKPGDSGRGVLGKSSNPDANPLKDLRRKAKEVSQEHAVWPSGVASETENGVGKTENENDTGAYVPDTLAESAQGFTVLLIGVDNRPGEKNISNTDTLILAHYNRAAQRLALLSVPRDTQINYPGFGKQKINAAARLGRGLGSTVKVMQNLLGQKIDGYIMVDFNGFKEIIDTLGGITVTVEKDMYYNTGDKADGIINLKKGTQRLNGTQALQYARFRHDNLADISRTMRQQAVLKAIAKETLQVKTLAKLPKLLPQVYQAVETDLSLGKMFTFFNLLRQRGDIEIVSQTLPGRFSVDGGISYWKVGISESRAAVRELFNEGKTHSIFSGNADQQTWGSWIEEEDGALPVMSPDIFGAAP